jgi:hypothetical protein
MLAVGAPAANAADVLAPASFDFGNQNVGTPTPKDDTPTFVIQATCDLYNNGLPPNACLVPPSGVHSYGAITVAGPGFSIVPDTDVCNARGGVLLTPSNFQPADACTLQVTFKPTSGGVKTGTLTTQTSPSGAPLNATLKGTGIVTGNPGTTTKKKCKKKKKRSASAAKKKKCKKKK